jgi:3-phenylpropionate/cinnamic acid dioxygenase small subunit
MPVYVGWRARRLDRTRTGMLLRDGAGRIPRPREAYPCHMAPDPADVVGIQQLLYKYGHIVDAHEWHRFEELFAPDCVLDYTKVHAPKVFHGIEEVKGYFRAANHPAAHHVANVWVDVVDGEYRVKSKFFVPFTRGSHVPKRWYGGDYDDVVVRAADGAWRFAQRVCSERWQLTMDEGDDIPVPRRTF